MSVQHRVFFPNQMSFLSFIPCFKLSFSSETSIIR